MGRCQSFSAGADGLVQSFPGKPVMHCSDVADAKTAQALSPVGRCQSFSAGADGYGRGEGLAVIALRASGGSGGSIAVIRVGACFCFLECKIIACRYRRSGGKGFATSALRAVGGNNTAAGTVHRGQCSGALLFVG